MPKHKGYNYNQSKIYRLTLSSLEKTESKPSIKNLCRRCKAELWLDLELN
nr:MAG TPA: protein of unknown function (DUF5109) [Bacteriophage sp.]